MCVYIKVSVVEQQGGNISVSITMSKAFVQYIYILEKKMNWHLTFLRLMSPMHKSIRDKPKTPKLLYSKIIAS